MKKIAIIEDNQEIKELLEVCLSENDICIETFSNGIDFINKKDNFDLIVSDINIDGPINGYETMVIAKLRNQKSKIVMLSGDLESLQGKDVSFIDIILEKPFDFNRIKKFSKMII